MAFNTSRLAKDDSIIIVGAGIFGLSTAIHLAQRGTLEPCFSTNNHTRELFTLTLTVAMLRLPVCRASFPHPQFFLLTLRTDINKIIRSAYGSQTICQDLSFEAIDEWNAWTEELRRGGAAVPPGMKSTDALWVNNGDISCTDADVLPEFESSTIENMEKAGRGGTQLVNTNPNHLRIAEKKGFSPMMQPFAKKLLGVLDTTGGITLADKACRFALHKAKRLGVRLVLDPTAGKIVSTTQGPGGRVTGIITADGQTHKASLTILACGGWTPSLVPALDGFAETTAGSVALFKIPDSLRPRFAPSRFPAWSFKIGDGAEAGLYGFPVDEDGLLKIGYRGTKYTNPRVQPDGRERSVPVTRWSEGEQVLAAPAKALEVIRRFTDEYLPELTGLDVWMTRLCWYTDSFDNHFIIDRVPEAEGLMVVTAGSGHAFKYLPTIGRWVVDIIEGKGLDRPAVKAWRWRSLGEGQTPVNRLMEGSKGDRALGNVKLASDSRANARL
ncbi:sarcosine oxidase [Colletotrichum sojae]|uniref:Sarcosine oxidase n=1 Tax=Colletotrichum sojae TaxID=2175907 RepID=A0A8H6MYT8_9PEZI|nr:sarcosine oxidase [Colletotrichum sojae]